MAATLSTTNINVNFIECKTLGLNLYYVRHPEYLYPVHVLHMDVD